MKEFDKDTTAQNTTGNPVTDTAFSSAFDCVILADGDFPTAGIPLTALHNAKKIICCDNAAVSLASHGFTPYAVVGDGDSLPYELQEKLKDRYIHISEQDDNDLTKATRYAISNIKPCGKTLSIAYLGCTGRREDHTLGNISLMARYMNDFGLHPVMLTDYGYFVPATGNTVFNTFARQQVSIFNITCSRLESTGLRWNSYAYKSLWQGTLNEATGYETTFSADGSYLVYLTYKPKSTEPSEDNDAQ